MTEGQSVVVVGGGPAGLATARAFRDAGGTAPVTIVATEPHLPYQRPPLTKEFLLGESAERDLPIEDAGWFAEHEVDLRTGVTATALDAAAHEVTLSDGDRWRTAAACWPPGPSRCGRPCPVATIRAWPPCAGSRTRARCATTVNA